MLGNVVGKRDNFNSPSIPVGQLLIECLGKHLYRKTLKKIFHILNPTQFIQIFIRRIASDPLAKVIRIATRVGISSSNVTIIFSDRKLDFNQRKAVITYIIFRNKYYQSTGLFLPSKHTKRIFRQPHTGIVTRAVLDFINHKIKHFWLAKTSSHWCIVHLWPKRNILFFSKSSGRKSRRR